MQPVNAKQFYKVLGDRLRRKRRALGKTQAQLASELGLARATIANIESGRQQLLVHQLYGFAAALSMKMSQLLPAFRSERHPLPTGTVPLPENLTPGQRIQILEFLRDPATLPANSDSKE